MTRIRRIKRMTRTQIDTKQGAPSPPAHTGATVPAHTCFVYLTSISCGYMSSMLGTGPGTWAERVDARPASMASDVGLADPLGMA